MTMHGWMRTTTRCASSSQTTRVSSSTTRLLEPGTFPARTSSSELASHTSPLDRPIIGSQPQQLLSLPSLGHSARETVRDRGSQVLRCAAAGNGEGLLDEARLIADTTAEEALSRRAICAGP
jgi:hypothetical protein